MVKKHCVLEKETEKLLREVKGLILLENKERKVTDDLTIRKALKSYKGVINGRR